MINDKFKQKFYLLTSREQEVLYHQLTGKTAREIAYLLGISTNTLSNHAANIREKYNVTSMSELAYKMILQDLDIMIPETNNEISTKVLLDAM